MMNELITKENERVKRLFGSLERMLSGIEQLVASHRPILGGERFLTDKEVSRRLKVSRRTLQDWRTNGRIYHLRLEEGQFKLPVFDEQTHTYKTTWQDLMLMVQGIDMGNYTRRKRWNPHEKSR